MASVNILLIDDHPLFRTGLRTVLESGLPGAAMFEAASINEAVQLGIPRPDALLLDVQLDGINGLTGISIIMRHWPTVPIIMISADVTPATVQDAMQRGAVAYVSKKEGTGAIIDLIGQVLNKRHVAQPVETTPAERASGGLHLTIRQSEVLSLLCQGLSNKIISQRLRLSEFTVRGHVQSIFATLQVSSRSEAIYKARRLGIVS